MNTTRLLIKNRTVLLWLICSSLFFSLHGMKFAQTIKTNREELEKKIVVLTKAGDDLLATGAVLQKELLNEITKQQKDLTEKKDLLKLPYSIVVEPFKFFETELAKEAQKKANDAIAQRFFSDLTQTIKTDLFQKTYNAIFLASLQIIKIPALPDVLKNLMALLEKVNTTMGSVKSKFEPIVRDIYSYVDIEQAKTALGLPANSYSTVNLEFVNKYRDYVNKVYAEKTGGGKFDARGIYSGLWTSIESFKSAVVRMKKIEEFFAGHDAPKNIKGLKKKV